MFEDRVLYSVIRGGEMGRDESAPSENNPKYTELKWNMNKSQCSSSQDDSFL